MTYRWREHVGPGDDYHLGFRDPEEADPWFADDQLSRLAEMVDPDQRELIEAEVSDEMKRQSMGR